MTEHAFSVALVGCGAISDNHLRGVLAAGQKICALCDILPERAEALAARHGLRVPVYRDYETMLSSVRPDAVHILTPHDLHAPMAAEALRRGIHVLCEKPLAMTEKQLSEVLAAEKASTARLGVCHQNRWEPSMRRLRETLSGDRILGGCGDVIWKRDRDYYLQCAWRGRLATEGGGVLINQALHTLDLLCWICGMPAYVTAHTANDHLRGLVEVEDTVFALFELPDGTPLQFFATTGAGDSFGAHLRLSAARAGQIHAETGYLLFDNATLSESGREVPFGKREWGCGHADLIRDFYAALQSGAPFPVDGKEAAKVVRLILSVYASHGDRIPVIGAEAPADGAAAENGTAPVHPPQVSEGKEISL